MAKRGRKPLDLTGRVFGRLTAVRRIDKEPEDTCSDYWWDCVCVCGGRRRVRVSRLTGGLTTSCGCVRDEVRRAADVRKKELQNLYRRGLSMVQIATRLGVSRQRVKQVIGDVPQTERDRQWPLDLAGGVYGRLTVVERAGSNRWGTSLWRCTCSCGEEAVVTGSNLTAGNTRSCGCLVRETSRRHLEQLKAERRALGLPWMGEKATRNEEVRRMWEDERLSQPEIGRRVGLTQSRVCAILKHVGAERRERKREK